MGGGDFHYETPYFLRRFMVLFDTLSSTEGPEIKMRKDHGWFQLKTDFFCLFTDSNKSVTEKFVSPALAL